MVHMNNDLPWNVVEKVYYSPVTKKRISVALC